MQLSRNIFASIGQNEFFAACLLTVPARNLSMGDATVNSTEELNSLSSVPSPYFKRGPLKREKVNSLKLQPFNKKHGRVKNNQFRRDIVVYHALKGMIILDRNYYGLITYKSKFYPHTTASGFNSLVRKSLSKNKY